MGRLSVDEQVGNDINRVDAVRMVVEKFFGTPTDHPPLGCRYVIELCCLSKAQIAEEIESFLWPVLEGWLSKSVPEQLVCRYDNIDGLAGSLPLLVSIGPYPEDGLSRERVQGLTERFRVLVQRFPSRKSFDSVSESDEYFPEVAKKADPKPADQTQTPAAGTSAGGTERPTLLSGVQFPVGSQCEVNDELSPTARGLLRRLQALADVGDRQEVSEWLSKQDESSLLEAVRSLKLPSQFASDVVLPLLECVGDVLRPAGGSSASLQTKSSQRLEVAVHVSGLARFHPDPEFVSAAEVMLGKWRDDPAITVGLDRAANPQPADPDDIPCVSVEEVAKILSVQRPRVYKLIDAGRFGPVAQKGTLYLFSRRQVATFASQQRKAGRPKKAQENATSP